MINESVVIELQRATHVALHVLASTLADIDLSPSEINALANMADGQGRTVSALGAAVGSRPATLTGILDRLERRDLVTRRSQPGDRRAVVVELTPAGQRCVQTIVNAIDDLERRALEMVSDDAVQGAHAVLRALIAAGS